MQATQQAKQEALVKLKAIDGLPSNVISSFETATNIPESSLNALKPGQRDQVQQIQSSYAAETTGATLGTGMAAIFGGGLLVLAFLITIPGQIIGFLLILRKKVWKCGHCGYVFERA